LAPRWPSRRSPRPTSCGFDDGRWRLYFRELRPRNQSDQTHGIGIFKVSVNGGDHNPSLHRDQVNADQRNPDPGVNDDAFVQYPVKNIDQARTTRYPFYRHSLLLKSLPISRFPWCSATWSWRSRKSCPGLRNLRRRLRWHRQVGIVLPPVEPDLLRFIY